MVYTSAITPTIYTSTMTSTTSIPNNLIEAYDVLSKWNVCPDIQTDCGEIQISCGKIQMNFLNIEFKHIKEIVPNKVYEFTFIDNTKIKTICDDSDIFDFEYMFYLAIAKKLFSSSLTFEGVLYVTSLLPMHKQCAKEVKKGMKKFKEDIAKKEKEEEKERIKKRQHQKYIEKKIKQKQRKKQEQINIIAEAIKKSSL